MRKRAFGAAAVVALAAGVMAGCGGGDDAATSGATGAASTAPTGTITSPAAAKAPLAPTVTLTDGSTAVTGGYVAGTSDVEVKVGDLFTLLFPPAMTGKEWKLVSTGAPDPIVELAGSGTATVAGKPDSDSFTYRAAAEGNDTLKFQEVETNPDGAPEPSLPVEVDVVVTK